MIGSNSLVNQFHMEMVDISSLCEASFLKCLWNVNDVNWKCKGIVLNLLILVGCHSLFYISF